MTRKKALAVLNGRKEHLENRIDTNAHKHLSYDEAEVAALEVAIRAIKKELADMSAEGSEYGSSPPEVYG